MLAGYITAGTVDLAFARRTGSELTLVKRASYKNSDFEGLEAILNHYMKRHGRESKTICLGVAGPVIDNKVITTNIPWKISGDELADKLKCRRVHLSNDLVTTAQGLRELPSDRFVTINKGIKNETGNIGLIAAGIGLGEAIIYRSEQGQVNCDSEGGHADFAPGNQLEAELWQYLYSEHGHIEVEDVLSLGGIERIYDFLVETQGMVESKELKGVTDKPGRIIELALSGANSTAGRTMDIFIDCYASEAANLALKGMTIGGIYLGGLIAPQIMTLLDTGSFLERFVKPGRMTDLLARMPVCLLIEDKTALIGAASLGLACDS